MRRSRVKILMITVALLALACWWAWQNRDRIAPDLLNPLLRGSQVESIQGLEIGLTSIRLQQITLTLESGSRIALRDIELQQPFDLLFGASENHSQLAIAELGYLPVQQITAAAPKSTAAPNTAEADSPTGAAQTPPAAKTATDALKLSELLQLLHQYLPQKIEISDLRWLGGPLERGKLALTREHRTDSIDLRISSERHQLELRLQRRAQGYEIKVQLRAGAQPAAMLSGALNPLDTENWKAQLQLQLTLQQLRKLPLPQSLSETLATATGTIKGDLGSRFPDRFLRLEQYRDTIIHLAAKDAALTLPESFLGAPLHIAFTTPEASTIAFSSLRPFRPRNIAGSGQLSIASLPGDVPLLNTTVDTRVSQGQPTLTLAGEVNFEALAPFLKSERWRSATGNLTLSSPVGDGSFRGTARLEPLQQIAAGNTPTVKALELTLLPKTRIGVTVENNNVEPSAENSWRSGTATLTLAEPMTLKATQWPGSIALTAPLLELEALPAGNGPSVSLRASDARCRIGDDYTCELTLDGTVQLTDMEATGTVQLQGTSPGSEKGRAQLHGEYRSDNLHFRLLEKYALDASGHGDFTLTGNDLAGKGALQAGVVNTRFTWRHQLDSGRGQASFTLPTVGFSREAPLSDAITGLPLDLVAGSIAAEGRVFWPSQNGDGEDALSLTLDQLAVVYGELFAVGTSANIDALRRDGQWITETPQPMRIDSVDVGLPIENIHFALSLDPQRNLALTGLSAELLGGKLYSPSLTWNLDGKMRHSQVHIEGISLEALTEEMDANNFVASGILDLEIPLVTSEDGITVEQGLVKARPPGGRLRYYGAFSPATLAGNPKLKLIAGALEDYNYRELSGTLEYPPSGDLRLQLKLVGRSESVAANRDLVINLNLENNIPDMLRSLQASRDLTEALETQLQ